MKGLRISLGLAALSAFCSFPALAGPVNINTADAATLAAELTGVGPALAEEIVATAPRTATSTRPRR